MRQFMIFALIALTACFAIDLVAGTGFTDTVKEYCTATSVAEYGTAFLAAGVGAAVVIPGESAEALVDKAKLWVISQSEFDDLQAKYRHLYILDIAFGQDEKYQFVARRPSKEVIQAIGDGKAAPFKVADMMIKNMIVAGDTDALDDGVVYSRTIELLTGIVKDGKKLFTKA